MSTLNSTELRNKFDAAKEMIKENNRKEAAKLLHEILEIEKEQLGIEAIFVDAKLLYSKVNRHQRIRRSRLILLSVFSLTLGLILFLALRTVGSTEVEFKIRVNELTFKLAKNWSINSLELESIGISHLKNLRLYPLQFEEVEEYNFITGMPVKWKKYQSNTPLKIIRTHDDWGVTIESSYLKLAYALIDSGSTITITTYSDPRDQFRITVSSGAVRGSIDTDDIFSLNCVNCLIEDQVDIESSENKHLRITSFDREVSFSDLEGSIDIISKIPEHKTEKHPYLLGKSIYTKLIDFSRFEGNTRQSTIIDDGIVYFSELDGKKIDIKEGDFLTVRGLNDFQIKRLFLDDRLNIVLKGRVNKFESGSQSFLYNRLPSILEWLYTNQFIGLVMASLIPIFSTIIIIFSRLKIIDEL